MSSLSTTRGILEKKISIFSKQATPLLKSQVFCSSCSNIVSTTSLFLEQNLSSRCQKVTTQGLLRLLTINKRRRAKVESQKWVKDIGNSSLYKRSRDDFRRRAGVKNRRGAAKRRCQQKKHWMTPRELPLGPHRDFLLSRPTQKLWFIWVQPSWCPFCSRSDVSSLCWPRRTQWPHRRHTGWRFPYSGLWICLQKPVLAASLQRGHPSQLLPPAIWEYWVLGRVRVVVMLFFPTAARAALFMGARL